MYWKLKKLPELQHLSEAERDKLFKERYGWKVRFHVFLKCMGIGLLIAIALGMMSIYLLDQSSIAVSTTNLMLSILVPAFILLGIAASYQFMIMAFRRQLRNYFAELREQGQRLPVCLQCGYAIANNVKHCPECGANV